MMAATDNKPMRQAKSAGRQAGAARMTQEAGNWPLYLAADLVMIYSCSALT